MRGDEGIIWKCVHTVPSGSLFHYIYILDYRYSNVNVIDFVKEKQADDLICINNISLIGDEDVAATISGVLQ